MTILAVYDHQQLQLPDKVLTHREDIDPLLADAGVTLEHLEQMPAIGKDDADQAVVIALEPFLAHSPLASSLPCLRVHRLDALPGYVDDGPHAVEQRFAQPVARLQVRGAGVICLHHGRQLLVLTCRRGDLLALPAQLPHWFVPSAGQPSLAVHAAESTQALVAETTGDDIARRYLVLEL